MLHTETNLLIKQPILVISGANGSGKTQLLEALLILLGEKSPRTKKGVFSLIGKADEECFIEIEVNNKKPDGTYMFQLIESDILDFLTKDSILFKAKITETKIRRFIGDPATGVYKEITLRLLQRLFSQLGIRPGNQLTFTLGETVDIFANQSNHKKFQVLIENLGLAELKEDIVNNEKSIREAIENTAKLQSKLKDEENNLELFRTMIDAINQRDKLENLLSSLTVEEHWVDVRELEKILEVQNQELTVKKRQVTDEKRIVANLEKENSQLLTTKDYILSSYRNARDEKITLEQEIKEVTKSKNTSEGTLKILKEQINEYLSEIDRLKKNFKDKNVLVSQKERLEEYLSKHAELKENYKTKTNELQNLESNKSKFSEHRLPNFELNLQEEASKFRNYIKEQHMQESILGPFISYLRLDDPDRNKSWLPAVKQALGSYLYSFVALDQQAFKKSKEFYDKLWPEKKPNFDVFRFENHDSKRTNKSADIYAFVPDLLAGDPRILMTLRRIVTTSLSEDKDPNLLLNAAVSSGLDILTKDGKSFYRRKGSFSRPPRTFRGELGDQLQEIMSFKDTRKEKKRLDDEIFKIKREETSLMKEIAELRESISLLSSSDSQFDYQIRSIMDRMKRAELKQQETEKELKTFQSQIEQKIALLQAQKEEEKKYSDQLSIIEKELTISDTNIRNARISLEKINQEYNESQNLASETKQKIHSLEEEAKKFGERPSEVRDKQKVELELKEVTTKLALIKDKSIPKEKLDEQEKRVVELRDNLEMRRDHLEHLREDIETRLEKWKSHVEPFIITLGEQLKEITHHIFADVKLTIDNEDLEKAGLELKAVTKGNFRNDQSLSGGEKVLLMECLILSLHALTISPLHVIDEFTQRLDIKNKAKIFLIVKELLNHSAMGTQFILITPDTLGLELESDIQHVVVSQAELLT